MKIGFLSVDSTGYFIHRTLMEMPKHEEDTYYIIALRSLLQTNPLKELRQFLYFYGLYSLLGTGILYTTSKVLDRIGSIVRLSRPYSMESVATFHSAIYKRIENVNDAEFIEWVKEQGIDLIITSGCYQIFKSGILLATKRGCINIHPAMLPKYRGDNPIFWALKNNESEIGVTAHFMDTKIDTGAIIYQKRIVIESNDTWHSLTQKGHNIYPQLVIQAIESIRSGKTSTTKQDHTEASHFPRPTVSDSREFREAGKKFTSLKDLWNIFVTTVLRLKPEW